MNIRLLYFEKADPQIFNLASIISYAYSIGELEELYPTLIVMEGFSRPFSYLGYYQDVDREVKIENCKRYNVELVRRWKLGMGNIFMDKITGGWAIIFPQRMFNSSTEAYDVLVGKVFLNAVKELGVKDAEYVSPNDIRIKGKKLCGTGVSILSNKREVLFFNGFTNLWRPDPELPFKVLNIPPEKFADKAIKKPEEYFASIDIDGILTPKSGDFRESLTNAIKKVFDAKIEISELNDEEEKIWSKYLSILKSEEFIFRRSTGKFMAKNSVYDYRFAQKKYRKLIQASVALSGNEIKDVMITGDFGLVPPDLDEDITRELIGLRCDEFNVAKDKVLKLMKEGYEIIGATPEEFITPVFMACKGT
ncbi:ligase [Sulfolobus sp. A20]|uniref:lipoate--protein ligase family protein n=1 Tax=Sulfolobaceae TaxID=118883 RepID=UPI000845C427|nr:MULTISPECIES: biotin/lipoate A/B protein ligase family protein [unclassified Sulfolobus]TRM74033.1 lipoate--protein ligase family protein [Sulfolobus sp. B5]TRM85465.1 lipoate--protein ligase family protein [Sulfolobus sp. F3]TRM89517.1 lipoate--protein ligase family protein [Sulfolobus sp. C3]TRM99167.1 lipoate--protein ligase family protein [Sulfolobus sp. F1]TRM99713.1 lipoate--protein ligase family protein [Sulfolobus sp. E1]